MTGRRRRSFVLFIKSTRRYFIKMNSIRDCGCKGIRTCLVCEKEYQIDKKSFYDEFRKLESFVYSPEHDCLYPGWNVSSHDEGVKDDYGSPGLKFPGILVMENFLTPEEGAGLMEELDRLPYQISQSGRRKQNFGPKTNFKKRKLQLGEFQGFPEFTHFIQKRFESIQLLKNFQTIEQCTLEYEPKKGACIDPHIDDCWIWGERVVTVNCCGDSVLTLTLYEGNDKKYNLDLVREYEDTLISPLATDEQLAQFKGKVIRIPMPNLSLIVLYGPARYQFEHSVLREDISERRVCIAYREFTPMYIEGVDSGKGSLVTNVARNCLLKAS